MGLSKNTDNGLQMNLRVGATIYPSQYGAIEQLLKELKDRCPAQFILLADTSGLFIMSEGENDKTDLIALSSLVAGDMAASREIAQRTGQYNNCQLIMREGHKVFNFIAEAGDYLLLFVQVSSESPLGWARILIRETGSQIAEVFSTEPEMVEKLDLGLDNEKLSDELGDALGSMWLG
jgi:predicted regulator of Ras-like GTPase activity (Roadblock/LC7/MglB family)